MALGVSESFNFNEPTIYPMKKKLLLIEPHSDDGIISAGGFLLKYQKDLNINFCLVTASDLQMYHGFVSRNERLSEYQKYVDYFGAKWIRPSVEKCQLPIDEESKLDKVDRSLLVKLMEKAIQQVKPNTIMVMGPSFHHDHVAVYEAVIAATRPTFHWSVDEIFILENPTYVHDPYPGQFTPNTYVSLTKHILEKKCELFERLFPTQIRSSGNYLSKEGIIKWAAYRGIQARCEYAEAFYQHFIRI